MTDTQIGPDGRPAVFDGSAWFSSDGRYYWNGAQWLPVKKPGQGLSLAHIGFGIVFLAIIGYAVYATVTTESAYTIGFYIGAIAFFSVLFVIFRFVGRWGWVGMLIRGICVFLAVLKVLTLIAHPPPS